MTKLKDFFLLVLTFGFMAGQAHAETVDEYNAKIEAAHASMIRLSSQIASLQSKSADLAEQVLKAKAEKEKAEKEHGFNWIDTDYIFGFNDASARIQVIEAKRKAYNDLVASRARLTTQIDGLNSQYQTYQAQADEASDKGSGRAKKLDDELMMWPMRITWPMESLNNKLDDVDDNLDALERFYDNKILGSYMLDKLTKLVNSPALCEAQKNCGTDTKVSAEAVRRDVFPNAKPDQTRKGRPTAVPKAGDDGDGEHSL